MRPSSPSPGMRDMLRRIAQDDASIVAGTKADDPGEDIVDPHDDPVTQVLKFCADKLSPDDLAQLEDILLPHGEDPPPPALVESARRLANDAALRLRRARGLQLSYAGFVRRFPTAVR